MRTTFLAVVMLLVSVIATAQPGTLDPSFGNGGIVKTIIGDKGNVLSEHPQKIFVQKDGKLLIVVQNSGRVFLVRRLANGSLDSAYGDAGVSDAIPFQNPCTAAIQSDEKVVLAAASNLVFPTHTDFQVIRITKEGRLDSTFGTNGRVITDFGYEADVPASVVIQNDGKIVVAGTASHDVNNDGVFAIARYNTDGSLDKAFDTDGKTTTGFGSRTFGNAVATMNDKIVVAGTAYDSSYNGTFTLARYNANGSLDTSFGQAGKTTTAITNIGIVAKSVAVDKASNIVVAGTAYAGVFNYRFTAVRYTSNGRLDYSFNGTGIAYAEFGHAMNGVEAMALQPDNKIVLGGHTQGLDSFNASFAIARFRTDGHLDTAFNGTGKATWAFEKYKESFIYSVALQPDGKVVATGFTRTSTAQDMALARYNTNGTLDKSFGQAGTIADFITAHSTSTNRFLIQSDGKALVSATVFNGDSVNSVLTRYTMNGAVDTLFGKNGLVYVTGRLAKAEALQTDSKIITGSYTHDHKEYALYRYHADGSIDSSYGKHGKSILFSGRFNGVTGVQIQSDNKLIVLSYVFPPNAFTPVYSITRYTADGVLDGSFGNGGMIQLSAEAYILRIQQDGKIITAGYESVPSNNTRLAIRRYTPNGTVDVAYGQNGKMALDFPVTDLAFQRNGDLILSGYAGNGPDAYNLISRITVTGLVDSTFGQQAKAEAIGGWLAIQDDDKIITGSGNRNASGYYNSMVSRFKADGQMDSTFGIQGSLEIDIDPKRNDNISQLHTYKNRLYLLGGSNYLGAYAFVLAYTLENTGLIKCPSDKVVSTDTGVCMAKVYGINPVTASGVADSIIRYKLTGATQGGGTGSASGNTFNKGVTYVSYYLQNDSLQTCTFKVTVNDTEAPVLNRVTLGGAIVQPANNNFGDAILNYKAQDNCGVASLTIAVTDSAGNKVTDWDVVDAHRLRLRSENSEFARRKKYIAIITCTDLSGNTTTKSVTLTVPTWFVSGSIPAQPLQVVAFPNPTPNRFFVRVKGANPTESVHIRVLNSTYNVVEVRKLQRPNLLQFGSGYSPGIYYVEAEQGGQKVVTKVVKLPD